MKAIAFLRICRAACESSLSSLRAHASGQGSFGLLAL
jgi:hypothetical protein